MTTPATLRMTFHMAGELVDSEEVPLSGDTDVIRFLRQMMPVIARRHHDLAEQAEAAGLPWLVEFRLPEMPEDKAYVRFGTDPDGMRDPHAYPNMQDALAALVANARS